MVKFDTFGNNKMNSFFKLRKNNNNKVFLQVIHMELYI